MPSLWQALYHTVAVPSMRRSGITAHEILAYSYQDGDGSMMLTGGETEAEEASGVGVHTDMCACVRVCKLEVSSGFPSLALPTLLL